MGPTRVISYDRPHSLALIPNSYSSHVPIPLTPAHTATCHSSGGVFFPLSSSASSSSLNTSQHPQAQLIIFFSSLLFSSERVTFIKFITTTSFCSEMET
ncbi:hypothetical protein RIF29_07631 [Crotalaria pallida]|uniref:Uncharacterized protein n=1 Tax=Crotalaria pallida TaxID=3830 RepID=A0AAN9J4B6_CROPI